jgi:serine/threonine-protein kinase
VTEDAARWARLEQLFDAALDVPADQRAEWVRAAASDDPQLQAQLQRMLAAHERPGVLDARLLPLAESDVRQRLSAALSEQYELGEALGSGGAATVFLARERKHDRSVVLKVLQPGVAAIIGPARFAEEVRIAARLAHPHILPLIDSGEADGLRYYVMPYVGGHTLRDRLREGPLPVATAITLLRDIADALAHAHAAGVVHRDLKPENVLCVGGHAFLLDFGVAQLETDLQRASRLTDPGMAIGTPGYMAPEQAAGEAVDHRADLYAWGLLAREILTGSRDPAARLADRRGMPPTLIALVGATLALDPAERPAGAGALVAALDGMISPVRARRSRWPRLAAMTGLVLLSGWLFLRRDAGGGTLAPGQLLQPVAVAPFRDETDDPALEGIGRLAADWITQGLHESGELRVVAWPAVRAAVERATDGDQIRAIRETANAGTIILGRIYRTGDELRLSADIVDAQGIVLAAPRPVIVPRDSSLAGIRELRERVLGALAVQRDPRLPAGAAFANRPPTHDAYLAFDRALSDYDAYRYTEATEGMLDAWRRDTSFTAALVYAAFAASNATDQPRADSLVREALARRGSMGAYHVAMSDHLAAFLQGDGPRALAAALRANELAPGSRAGYNAARTLLAMNRPAEAEAMLASLDPEHGPMRGWPAYWSQRAYAAHLLGQHEAALGFAREMHRRHPEQRVTTVLEARALASLGRMAELDSLFRAAEALPPEVYWSQGAMRTVAAEELMVHGDTLAGMALHADAEDWLRDRLAREPGQADHRYWLATALIGQRKWREADTELSRLLRTEAPRLRVRGMAALVAGHRGDRARAERLLQDATPDERGEWLAYRARLAAIFGEREEALQLLGEAIATGVRLSIGGWHWVHGAAVHDFATLRNDPELARLLAPVPPPAPPQ